MPAVPKGIVHSHNMRWTQIRLTVLGLDIAAVSIVSTPLYSNTTLVPFFATLCHGGTVVLMERFDAAGFLQLAERHRATHAMLVPVQCQRIMALPDFDSYDLKSFVMKSSTVAPPSACLKADILKRWPGGLTEFYGMTEGGGACILAAHLHPTKLHTVGKPVPGSDIRLIDEEGKEVPQGESGEIVAHSAIIARLIAMQHSQCDEHRELLPCTQWVEADAAYRFGDETRILARRQVSIGTAPAWEQVLARLATGHAKIVVESPSRSHAAKALLIRLLQKPFHKPIGAATVGEGKMPRQVARR